MAPPGQPLEALAGLEALVEAEAAMVETRERLSRMTPGLRALMIGGAGIDGFAAAAAAMAARHVEGTALERAGGGMHPACARLLGQSLDAACRSACDEVKSIGKSGDSQETIAL